MRTLQMTRRMLLWRQDRGSQDCCVIGQSDTDLSSDWLSLSTGYHWWRNSFVLDVSLTTRHTGHKTGARTSCSLGWPEIVSSLMNSREQDETFSSHLSKSQLKTWRHMKAPNRILAEWKLSGQSYRSARIYSEWNIRDLQEGWRSSVLSRKPDIRCPHEATILPSLSTPASSSDKFLSEFLTYSSHSSTSAK